MIMENPILLHVCADTVENPKANGLHNIKIEQSFQEFFSTPIAYFFISPSMNCFIIDIIIGIT